MGFLSKLTNKTANKAADRVSDKIVDSIFGRKKKDDGNEVVQEAPVETAEEPVAEVPQEEPRQLSAEEMEMINASQANAMKNAEEAMGIAYNTKRCPECQAICLNAPVTCPYCGADLKAVKPLTPKELEELGQ
jgi:rubrerythrin